jgi:peptide/nickel transport system substrate-binding protein
MSPTIGRRRLLLLMAGASLGLAACSGSQPSAPPSESKPAAPAPTTAPGAANTPAAASPVAAGATPAAAASPGAAVPAGASAGPPPGTTPGGTFVIASLGPLPKTAHPYPNSGDYSDGWTQVAGVMFGGGLLDQDANTLEYRPYAAAEWNVSQDGKTFTFKLRPDLKWSDGKPITVDDYLFAYGEATKEDNDFVGLEDLQRIDSFTSPSAGTLVVVLKDALAKDVAIGAATGIAPVPKHVWQGKSWTDPAANPEILKPTVVCGAYMLQDWNAAEGATFVRNPNWFKGQANFEKITIKPSQQPTVAYELLKSNQAQWAPNIPPSQYTEAKQNPSLTMYEWTAANSAFRLLDFNLARDPFKDKKVREALCRALNRQDMIQVAELGLGQPQFSFVNPANTKWYNPDVEKYDFDMAKAKQLLQEAGYQGGKMQVLYPTSSAPRGKIAAYMQQQLKQLGIDLEVKGLDANAFFVETKQKNFDLAMGTWGGGSIDPDLGSKGIFISTGTQNYTSFNNKQVDDLFTKGSTELDESKRKQIYADLQKLITDELPSFFLYSLTSFSPMSKKVVGVTPTKFESLDVNDAMTRWAYSAQ